MLGESIPTLTTVEVARHCPTCWVYAVWVIGRSTLASVLHDTRAFDGCIGVTTHRGLDDSSQILLIEEWESREHYLAYLQWRVETGLLGAIGPMLAGEPVTNLYSNTTG